MRLPVAAVAIGCSLALTWAKTRTDKQPTDDLETLRRIEQFAPSDKTAPNPSPRPNAPEPSLDVLVKQFEAMVKSWSEPWQSVGNAVLGLLKIALVLVGLAIWLFLLAMGGLLGLGLIMAVATGIKKLCIKISANPAPFRTIVSSGLGAGFGLLLFLAIVDLCEKGLAEMFKDFTAIAIVSFGAVILLEPLEEWFSERLGAHGGDVHDHARQQQRWYLRAAAFGVLAAVSLSHGLLHQVVEENVPHAISLLGAALLIPGAITYVWIVGSRSAKRRAAALGALGGAVAGAICWLAVLLIEKAGTGLTKAETMSIFINGVQWGVAGFLGGFAIDHHWGSTPARAVGVAVIVALVSTGILGGASASLIFQDLARALGWAGGLLAVEPAACAAFGYGACSPGVAHETVMNAAQS